MSNINFKLSSMRHSVIRVHVCSRISLIFPPFVTNCSPNIIGVTLRTNQHEFIKYRLTFGSNKWSSYQQRSTVI